MIWQFLKGVGQALLLPTAPRTELGPQLLHAAVPGECPDAAITDKIKKRWGIALWLDYQLLILG